MSADSDHDLARLQHAITLQMREITLVREHVQALGQAADKESGGARYLSLPNDRELREHPVERQRRRGRQPAAPMTVHAIYNSAVLGFRLNVMQPL
jgi:hypothetical protein